MSDVSKCAVLSVIVCVASAIPGQSVSASVARAEREGFQTAVLVRDVKSEKNVYGHRADEFLIPASNQKLLTAAATLWGLGHDFQFRTVFRLRGGVLEIHAAGDPNWIAGTDHDAGRVFRAVAAALRQKGVTRLQGIRLDAGVFTGATRPTGWPRDQFDRAYCAPTGGLVLESSCFSARIAAGPSYASVSIIAPPLQVQVGGTIQISKRSKKRFSYWVSQGGDSFTGHGEFSAKARPVEVRGVVQNPAWVFEKTARTILAAEGVVIAADAAAVDTNVLTWKSGLQPAFRQMLESSSNFHAEQLLRTLGAQMRHSGTFAAGCASVRAALATRLKIPDGLRVVDGSGLSRGNQVSPAFIVALLAEVFAHPHGALILDSLPHGGRTGTLKRRFRGKGQADAGKATRAKTGYINGVRSLSGIVVDRRGRPRLFSILMNRRRGTSTKGAAALQDAIVTAIYKQSF